MEKNSCAYHVLSKKDTLRFRSIVLDNLMKSASLSAAESDEYDGIGRLAEKQMHSALKTFICPDEKYHEITIQGSPLYIPSDEENPKKRKYVADILRDNTIYEIQTGSFAPLRDKIKWILEHTSYHVVVIHPIAETKWISKIDKSGKISGRRRSPVHGRVEDIASELYYFTEFLSSPRFSLMIIMMEAEQYVRAGEKRGRRLKKYELIPVSLIGAYTFASPEDYSYFLPNSLPDTFTVKEYSAHARIYGMDAYSITKTLCALGLISETDKIGRARAYKIKKDCE